MKVKCASRPLRTESLRRRLTIYHMGRMKMSEEAKKWKEEARKWKEKFQKKNKRLSEVNKQLVSVKKRLDYWIVQEGRERRLKYSFQEELREMKALLPMKYYQVKWNGVNKDGQKTAPGTTLEKGYSAKLVVDELTQKYKDITIYEITMTAE